MCRSASSVLFLYNFLRLWTYHTLFYHWPSPSYQRPNRCGFLIHPETHERWINIYDEYLNANNDLYTGKLWHRRSVCFFLFRKLSSNATAKEWLKSRTSFAKNRRGVLFVGHGVYWFCRRAAVIRSGRYLHVFVWESGFQTHRCRWIVAYVSCALPSDRCTPALRAARRLENRSLNCYTCEQKEAPFVTVLGAVIVLSSLPSVAQNRRKYRNVLHNDSAANRQRTAISTILTIPVFYFILFFSDKMIWVKTLLDTNRFGIIKKAIK